MPPNHPMIQKIALRVEIAGSINPFADYADVG
jgi:hypothetical protein